MADEATINSSLIIKKDNLFYYSQPTGFTADVSGTKGPTPGAVTVPTDGKDIDLSEITEPGLCRFQNLDQTNYVEIGIYEPTGTIFYPLLELLPGETFVMRLSRNLLEQYAGSGTGTTGPENKLRLKANTASCVCLVDVFER